MKSKHLIAKKLAIYNFLTVLLEQKTFFLRWGFLGEVQNYFPFVMGSDRTRTLL